MMPRMHQTWKRMTLIAGLGFTLLQLFLGLGVVGAAASGTVTLAGNRVPMIARGQLNAMGATDPDTAVTLVLGLKAPDAQGLATAAAAVRDRRMAPLGVQEFTGRYAPDTGSYNAVADFLRHSGFSVDTSPNRLVVTAQGTIRQAEAAFGVTIKNYLFDGQSFFASANEPQVPAALAGLVQSVAGLDDFPAFRPMSTVRAGEPAGNSVHASVYQGSNGFTPLGIEKAYDVTPVYSSVYGTGQTVDVVIWDAINQSDIDEFDATYGLPDAGVNQIPVGGTPPVDFNDNDGSGEGTLDADSVHSLAPGAAINLYEAVNNYNSSLEQAINEAVVQQDSNPSGQPANILSMSWGGSEGVGDWLAPSWLATLDQLFAEAAAQGMTVLASSGDNGAFNNNGNPPPSVASPADDPYVTAVGGTYLTINADGTYAGETTWNQAEGHDSFMHSGWNLGGGGGFSVDWSAPAWQTGTVDNWTYGATDYNPGAFKGVPDVSLDAGNEVANYAGGKWLKVEGTSFSVQAWAGMAALLDQGLSKAGKPPLGDISAVLYPIGPSGSYNGIFHDVTTGTNDTVDKSSPYYYPAKTGWDPATGWGSPDFQQLLNYLVTTGTAPAPVVTVSPAALPPGYTATAITVTGRNTHFDDATTVSVQYNGSDYVVAGSGNTVSGTAYTFRLKQGLPAGQYQVQVTDSADGPMTAALSVGAETVTVSPAQVTEGYAPLTIVVNGQDTYFQTNSVTAQVVLAATQAPAPGWPSAVNAGVSGTSRASFALPAGLPAGNYDVVVNDITGGSAMDAPLTVVVPQASQLEIGGGGGGGGGSNSPASKLVITSPAVSGPPGSTADLGPVTVVSEDAKGNSAPVTAATAVNLSSDSPGTAVFSLTNGGPPVTSVTIASGADSAGFYYGDTKAGTPTITAAATGLTSATQTETITAAAASPIPSPISSSVGPAGATVATADGSASVSIPANAFSSTVEVSISVVRTVQAYAGPAGFVAASWEWSIGAGGSQPSQPVTATFKYNQDALGGVSPSRLGVYLYDPASDTWSWAGGVVDTADCTVTVTLTHFSIYAVFVNKAAFSDLSAVPWAGPAIDTLLGSNVVAGTAPGIFDPDGVLSRAQFATLLVRAQGLTPVAGGGTPFADVPASAWYAPYVAIAYRSGLVAGTSATTFDPDDPVTREQMAVMMARLPGAPVSTATGLSRFKDADEVASWAVPGLESMVGAGIMTGLPDGTFQPAAPCLRDQAAVVITRYLRYIGKV